MSYETLLSDFDFEQDYREEDDPVSLVEYLYERYPDRGWNLGKHGISAVRNLSLGFIRQHMNKSFMQRLKHGSFDWSEKGLSKNNNIDEDFLDAFPDKPWNLYVLFKNPNFSIEYIRKKMGNLWRDYAVYNPNLTEQIVRENMVGPNGETWDFEMMALNPSIRPGFVLKMLRQTRQKETELLWKMFSSNPSITPSFIRRYTNKPWDQSRLIANPTIPIRTLRDSSPLYWDRISEHSKLTEAYVKHNINQVWNWISLAKNPNISLEFLRDHAPEKELSQLLSLNPNITVSFVDANADDLCWGAKCLSENQAKLA